MTAAEADADAGNWRRAISVLSNALYIDTVAGSAALQSVTRIMTIFGHTVALGGRSLHTSHSRRVPTIEFSSVGIATMDTSQSFVANSILGP